MAMLGEWSQTQSTSVIMYPHGCPVKILYIQGSFKLHFKLTMELMPFKLHLFSVLLHVLTHLAYWVEFQSFEQYAFDLHKCSCLSQKEIILYFLDKVKARWLRFMVLQL